MEMVGYPNIRTLINTASTQQPVDGGVRNTSVHLSDVLIHLAHHDMYKLIFQKHT